MAQPWEQNYAPPEPPKSLAQQARESEFAQNAARSFVNLGGQIGDAAKGFLFDEKGNRISVDNPLGSTPKGLLNLGTGLVEKMVPGPGPHEQYPEAMGRYYAGRYGSLSNLGKTAYEDPFGTAADASMLFSLGGAGAKAAATVPRAMGMARTAGALGTTGEILNTMGAVTDPIRAGINVVAHPLLELPIVNRLSPENLYQSAFKPRPSLSKQRGKVESLVRTGLEEGLPITERAVDRGWSTVEALDKYVQSRIDAGTRRGVIVDPTEVAKYTADVKARFKNQLISGDDLREIDALTQQFLDEHQTPMTATEAQAAKQGTYRKLQGKFGKESTDAAVETLKALARGTNTELRKFIPEITEPNVRNSKLLDFMPELERSVARTGNYQFFNLGTTTAAGAVGAATQSPELAVAAGLLTAVFDHPSAKSKLAIAIYNGMKANPRKYGVARMTTATARANEYIESLRQRAAGTEAAPATAGP